MKETLYLSFHLREILPGVGETCFASGFAGCYRIRVREILGQKALANGFIQLKIRGERELIDPSPSDEKRKEGVPMHDEEFRAGCVEQAHAIEEGASLTRKITGRFFQLDCRCHRAPRTGMIVGTCAIGAALIGKQGTRDYARLQRVRIFPLFPALYEIVAWPDGIEAEPCNLFRVICGFNNGVQSEPWTREAIGVWLRTARRAPVCPDPTMGE